MPRKQAARAPVETDAAVEQAPRTKRKRVPIGGIRKKLHVTNKDPNYFYYWAKEEGDQVQMLRDAFYEDVTIEESGNTPSLENQDASDSADGTLRVHGGYGERGPYKLRLMRQRMDYHKEDQALEKERVDAADSAIQRQEFDGQHIDNKYGDVSISVKDTE